ncbi:MAG: lipopolysaccharide transport periplasmic protein LptA [Brachymonas sp.]|nr:lipopolysaccharide transport periplasmic protein LptA [Brachymonas sp.]
MPTTPLLPIARLLAVALAGIVASSVAWAEKADRQKPMNAEADSLRYDDVKQISVFTGNVVITKGTMIIRADRVEVRQDSEGFQFGTATSTGGKRAFFRQKRDTAAGGVDEWIEGDGEVIVYDGKADTVTFRQNAHMRRLRGTTVSDEAQGALITYDNSSDVFNVAGTPSTGGAPAGRVRAVLSPRSNAAAGASTSPAATQPASPATPGTNLRPSTTLGADKK